MGFDRIKEAFEKVAKDEAMKLSTVQEIMLRNTDYLRRIIAPAGGEARRRYDVILVPALQQFPDGRPRLVGLLGKGRHNWWCAICGEKYDWKQPDTLLVVQTGESVNQAKVFRAHAVPQGLCGNLINALKLLANQQEDGDGLIQNIVTNLCEGEQERPHSRRGSENLYNSTIILPLR